MRRLFRAVTIALVLLVPLPAWAHGDHDARPLLRHADLGPYTVSLWQVYPDAGSAMMPMLVVMFDEGTLGEGSTLSVRVGGDEVGLAPSLTTAGAWETTSGLETDDSVIVTISEDGKSWTTPTVIVPPPLTSMLPMRGLIAVSIFLATAVAWWIGGRTAMAWRRPITYRDIGLEG
ncbi:MAG TPA: hypothetical protein VFP67_08855 [Acidimicrobiia bacterium]|nr:hypothetical protein [Acidimicrobiia bacterium]